MDTVASLGSVWIFDHDRYLRLPKSEVPRQNPSWGSNTAGPCQDNVWHDYKHWWITDDGEYLIIVPVLFGAFWAPMTTKAMNGGPIPLWDMIAEHLGEAWYTDI